MNRCYVETKTDIFNICAHEKGGEQPDISSAAPAISTAGVQDTYELCTITDCFSMPGGRPAAKRLDVWGVLATWAGLSPLSHLVPEKKTDAADACATSSAAIFVTDSKGESCIRWTRTDRWDLCMPASRMMTMEVREHEPSVPAVHESAPPPSDCVMIEGGACIAREKLRVGEQKEDIFAFYSRLLSEFAQSASASPMEESMGWR